MYKDINDYELLYLVAENDEAAYNDLFSKYDKMIRIEAKKFYRRCDYLGISLDDIYQAGLYGFSLAIDNFDEKEGVLFYTYANTFIVREIQTLLRNHGRYKHALLSQCVSLDKEVDDEGNLLSLFIDNGVNIVNQCEEHLIQMNLLNFKYELPFLYSLIYELRLNSFNNKEISELLGIKYKTVDNAIMSIKNKLKKELNKIELCN